MTIKGFWGFKGQKGRVLGVFRGLRESPSKKDLKRPKKA